MSACSFPLRIVPTVLPHEIIADHAQVGTFTKADRALSRVPQGVFPAALADREYRARLALELAIREVGDLRIVFSESNAGFELLQCLQFPGRNGMKQLGQIYLGTSAFTAAAWEGGFHPTGLKPGAYRSYSALHFNTVEVDATFYRIPSLSTVRG